MEGSGPSECSLACSIRHTRLIEGTKGGIRITSAPSLASQTKASSHPSAQLKNVQLRF